ncbi:hypothetical protein Lpp41_06480, partial [Lacticaseibacillus paracasei subsp. paracasei Lpp41]
MHNVAKLVALDMGALYSGTHKYRWWSYLDLYAAFIVAVGMIARFNPIHDYHAIIWMLFFATGLVLLQMTLSFPLM